MSNNVDDEGSYYSFRLGYKINLCIIYFYQIIIIYLFYIIS